MESKTTQRAQLGQQIFGAGSVPDGEDLSELYAWGFSEEYWLEVPDAERFMLDSYMTPRAAVAGLFRDLVGEAGTASIRYHYARYVDLLHGAWRLGAGENSQLDQDRWRRQQAVADAYYSVTGGDVDRAVAVAYSAWGGWPIPAAILQELGAARITAADWEQAGEHLRLDLPDRDAGALIKLLLSAYDAGHLGPGSVSEADLPPSS
jgi:hypothetical protein